MPANSIKGQEIERSAMAIKMLPHGIEPWTSRLLAERSNQLSYETSGNIHAPCHNGQGRGEGVGDRAARRAVVPPAPPTHPTTHARARVPPLVLVVYARVCAKRAHAARAASIVAPGSRESAASWCVAGRSARVEHIA